MKLYTACFWTHMTQPNTVSIAWKTPAFYKGPSYKVFAPPAELVWAYKDGAIDWDAYEVAYRMGVLGEVDPARVQKDLLDGTTLLCWERSGNCHRHIVRSWLNENGIECEEAIFG